MEQRRRMLPVIRKTHSSNNGFGKKLLHCLFLAFFLFVSFFLLSTCAKRTSRLEDFSGGRYAETFKTDNSVLKKELLSLRGPIVEQELKSSGILDRFHQLHWRYGSLVPTSSGETYCRPLQEKGEAYSFSELYPGWLETFHALLGEVRRPLKGVEAYAGEFSDFQMILLRGCQDSGEKISSQTVLKTLNVMLDYAYVMMFSDHPDISYLETAVRSAERVLRKNRFSARDRLLLRDIVKRNLARPFPQRNLICYRLLRSLRDFEKVRLNGLRLFMGEQKPGTSLKESVSGGRRSSFFAALRVWVRDFFYDVDRDQIQTIRMYKTFLKDKAFLTVENFEARYSKAPSRPMARREYELFRDELRRHSEALDGLRNLLPALEVVGGQAR